jgi:hypothetical protein
MNRRITIIAAALSVAVIGAIGIAIYLERGGPDNGQAITGPGRAAEARGIIADIQNRSANTAEARPAQPAANLINPPQPADRGQPANAGAVAVTPEPARAAPTGAGAELDAAFEQARELQAAGQLDDAHVLFFFGARQGHARSAFAYAEVNDPNHHSPETSMLDEPDAFQAFRWYTAALDGGVDDAAGRLDALREWAETAAAAGDAEAERLLLQWE